MASIGVQVLGAGKDIGKSCLLAIMGSATVMFDCGAHPGFGDPRRFPDFSSTDLSSLSLVLITHFHLDHAAALPLLTEILHVKAPVYMTEPTRDLSRLMLLDFARTSNIRGQHCPFSATDVATCMERVRLIGLDSPLSPPECPEVEVTAYHAGHALGAVMFRVATDEHTIIYSGDYTSRADRHLSSARFEPCTRPHLFVTETTHCASRRCVARHETEDGFLREVASALSAGGRVLIPVPAFGRVQQITATLAAGWDAHSLGDVPVYVTDGLLLRANAVYERFPEWRCDNPGAYAHDVLGSARAFKRARDWGSVVAGGGPCILFATPGNLSTGLSRDVFRAWASDKRNLVIVPAISVEARLAGETGPRDPSLPGGKPVRCRISNLAFGVHADAAGIRNTIASLKPVNVMLVHGDAARVEAFQRELEGCLECPVFAPENGDIVEVKCPVYGGPDAEAEKLEKADVGEEQGVREYLAGCAVCEAGFTGLGYAERTVADRRELWRKLEEVFGKDLETIDEEEYCFMQCITVTASETDGSVVLEWAKATSRPLARKVLKVIDDFCIATK